MRLNELKSSLENFVNNDKLSAILIDGEWGIGKTYYVTKYLETLSKKKYKIAYASLFGKENIAEVNTEMYNCLAKTKRQILNIINPVIKLVNAGISTTSGFNINLGGVEIGSSKVKSNKNYTTICVLDDLERNSNIDFDQIIGFVNNLILQGIKVICLTYSKIIDGNELYRNELMKFKEKVFDRTYQINDNDNETLENVLKENSKYIPQVEFLEIKNIRTYIKSNTLFNEIIKKTKYNEDMGLIFSICLAVVHEEATKEYSNQYKEKIKDKKYVSYAYSGALQDVFKRSGINIDYNFFTAIFNIYYENNYKLFTKITGPDETKEILKPLFYFSDEDKITHIKLQEKYILTKVDNTQENKEIISSIIHGWFSKECEHNDILKHINVNKIYDILISIGFYFDPFWEHKQALAFKHGYEKYSVNTRLENLILSLSVKKDSKTISKTFSKLYKDYYKLDNEIQHKLLIFLIKQDFFITDIHGTTTEEKWELAHTICKMSNHYVLLKTDLKKYLDTYKNKYPKDKQLQLRIDSLIEQYKIQENIS